MSPLCPFLLAGSRSRSTHSLHSRRFRRFASGGALVMVMVIICVLSVVAGSLLLITTTRYHTTFQSASWQESIVGAEAGVDLAMTELRKRVVAGPSQAFKTGAVGSQTAQTYWTTLAPNGKAYANYGHAFPAGNQPYSFPGLGASSATHQGEGNQTLAARVFVDVPGSDAAPASNFAVAATNPNNAFISQFDNPALRDPDGVDRARWWYRIRALGVAGVSGTMRPNLEKQDNRLRRFSLLSDWRTGDALAAPQVARLVEVIAQPQMNFRNALMADQQIDLSHNDVLIDSYDSSKGNYGSTNHGQMGNIATNGKLINADHATVNGNALTNNGSVNDGDNVSGQQSGNFYQELTPVTNGQLNPAWSGVKDSGTITTDTTYKASADATNPTLVRLDGINLAPGGNIISVNAPDGTATGTPSYIKIYVQGDIATREGSYINVQAGVNAVIYFTGNVNLQGDGIFNNTLLARNLVLNGLQPPANSDGTYPARSISISTYQDFEGIVYAPNHDVNLALQAVSPAAQQLSELQADQRAAIRDYNIDYQTYITDMATTAGVYVPLYPLTVATYASNLSLFLPAPRNPLTIAEFATLQAGLNKVAQTEIQIESLQGTLMDSQKDDHARGYNGIYGGFVARTITVAEKTHVHYDETLRNAGPVNHYEIVSWFEDNAARGTTGTTSAFWWAGAK